MGEPRGREGGKQEGREGGQGRTSIETHIWSVLSSMAGGAGAAG